MRILRQLQYIGSLINKLISVTESNVPTDYNKRFDEVISGLKSINADTSKADEILASIDKSDKAITDNTKETIAGIEKAISELAKVDANTKAQEKLLTEIINTLTSVDAKELSPAFIGDSCASVKGGEPDFVGITALYDNAGSHKGARFVDKFGADIPVADVKLLDECECKIKDC